MHEIIELPLTALVASRYQPRKQFAPAELTALAAHIKLEGIIAPLIVMAEDKHYAIIAGERRWRAAQLAGLSKVPCLIRCYDAKTAARIALVENTLRVDLNPIEEATALQQLMTDYHYTQATLAEIIGKPRSTLANLLRLLTLDQRVQQLLMDGQLTVAHGKALAGLFYVQQVTLAARCVRHAWSSKHLTKVVQKLTLAQRVTKTANPNIASLNANLGTYLGAKVEILHGKKAGIVKLRYADLEHLDSILARIGFTAFDDTY